ncbi:MAG: type II toxin-antitoxin system HicB family antitoxin [Deltaproteobacteria bacterium]|nr:type II toxin-antitoxin system HicB family antitoxin [Deltaproteobacteria bacterium]
MRLYCKQGGLSIGFTVYAPSLPGCISEGDTAEEAMTNIREAIKLHRLRYNSTAPLRFV